MSPPVTADSEQDRRAGGRPGYKPTDEQRALVASLVTDGTALQAIAERIGVSPKTLRKHFSAELGMPRREAQAPLLEQHDAGQQPAPIGRPAFEPTMQQREDVRLCKCDDWSDDQIAQHLGLSRTTLLKYFAEELDYGVRHVRLVMMRSAMREVRSGNMSAFDRLAKLRGMLAPVDRLPGPEQPQPEAPPPEEEPLGKKERANRDALTAHEGTSWGNILKH